METFEKYLVSEVNKYETRTQEAFESLMNLVRDKISDEDRSEVINFFVKATQSSFWGGRAEHALQLERKGR